MQLARRRWSFIIYPQAILAQEEEQEDQIYSHAKLAEGVEEEEEEGRIHKREHGCVEPARQEDADCSVFC